MGNARSVPRTITIDNPDDASIIAVSENVLHRLQEIKPSSSEEPLSETASVVSGDIKSNDRGTTAGTIYVSSHQIRNHIDTAIENNNVYWESRMKALREGYNRINFELKSEYDKAIVEVNKSWGKQYLAGEMNSGDYINSCKDVKRQVIQCYETYKDRPLLCFEHVKSFNRCVSDKMDLLLKAN